MDAEDGKQFVVVPSPRNTYVYVYHWDSPKYIAVHDATSGAIVSEIRPPFYPRFADGPFVVGMYNDELIRHNWQTGERQTYGIGHPQAMRNELLAGGGEYAVVASVVRVDSVTVRGYEYWHDLSSDVTRWNQATAATSGTWEAGHYATGAPTWAAWHSDGALRVLDAEQQQPRWVYETRRADGLVADRDHVCGFTDPETPSVQTSPLQRYFRLTCFEVETGTQLWQSGRLATYRGQLSIQGPHVYHAYGERGVVVYDKLSGRVLRRWQPEVPAVAATMLTGPDGAWAATFDGIVGFHSPAE